MFVFISARRRRTIPVFYVSKTKFPLIFIDFPEIFSKSPKNILDQPKKKSPKLKNLIFLSLKQKKQHCLQFVHVFGNSRRMLI